MKINTTEMNPELRQELLRLGWADPEKRTTWGRRVSGDAYGVEIERNGVVKYYAGPFSIVREGDQIAIVRWN